jgi:type IV secretion system protein VirB4
MSRILRDYSDAGGLNTLLAPWGFVEEATLLTKAGHLAQSYAVRGIDVDALTHPERHAHAHRMEAALRALDERCRVYQYLVKRNADAFVAPPCPEPIAREAATRRAAYLNARRSDLYRLELFMVLVYEPPARARVSTSLSNLRRSPRDAVRSWLSTSQALHMVETELDAAVEALAHKAELFETQLVDFGLARMSRQETFRLLRRLVNYDAAVVDASMANPPAVHVDYFMGDSAVECHRDHLMVGRRTVKVLSMKEAPGQTHADALGDLFEIPGEFIACLEWQRIPSDRMRRDVQTRRRHFFNQRVSLVNYVTPGEARTEDMLVDESASAMVRQLGDALTDIEVNGHVFGNCSLTLVLHGEDLRGVEHQAAQAAKALSLHDGAFIDETYNLLNAWLSIVPGNGARNLRRLPVLETHAADLSFLFTIDAGAPDSALLAGPVATLESPHHTPFDYHLHVEDVGHTLVLGATGSGKSFLLNFLITSAQQFDPFTIVLDLGHSYRKLTELLHGRYVELGLRQNAVTINPFSLDPTPEHLHFLHAFVRVLLEGDDGYRLSDAEDREVYEAVENLYALQRSQRRLFTVANLLPRGLAARMQKWVDGGRYADLFDNVEDTLTFDRLQVFDFEAMRSFPTLLEPLLFYVLHRVNERVLGDDASRLTLCVMDEAWRLIQHPTLRAYVQEALKTWRKRNAAMVLSTQAVEDFASVDLLRTVVEGCPTKLLLANPALDRSKYAEFFQLNEMELDLLAALAPRSQLLLKRPQLTKVLTLSVDPKSYWIYTNTPIDNQRVAAVLKEQGLEAGLDRLAASV